MLHEDKIAAAILSAALAPRATEGQSVEQAQMTLLRLYHNFLAQLEKPGAAAHHGNDDWRVWAQQIMGVLPH
jgi:hypothetical protein